MYTERSSKNAITYKVSQVNGIERVFDDIDYEPNNNFFKCHKVLWFFYELFKQVTFF